MVNANIDFVGVLEHFSPEGKPQKALSPGMLFVWIKEKATDRAEDAATSH
jgi:hypothetical protein